MSSTSGIRAGRAYVELGIDDKLAAALKVATARLRNFATMIRDVGAGVAAVSGAVSAALTGATASFAATGSAAYDMSKRTGLSAQAVTELGYAAQQSGSDLAGLETSLKKMQKTVGEAANGSQAAIDSLAQLGLTVEDLAGLNPDEQFMAIAGALANIPNPTMRAAASLDIFGRTGTSVLTMLDNGVVGLRAMRAEARELGATLSDEAAAKADRLGDAFDKVKAASAGVFNAVGEALADGYSEGLESIAKIVAGTSKWIRENQELVVTIAKVAAVGVAVGGVLVGVGVAGSVAFGLVSSAVSAAVAVIGAFKVAVLAAWASAFAPITLVVAAIAGAVAAVLYFSGTLGRVVGSIVRATRSAASSISNYVGETFSAIRKAMEVGDLTEAGRIFWLALSVEWLTGINNLKSIWGSFSGWLERTWQVVTENILDFFVDMWQEIVNTIITAPFKIHYAAKLAQEAGELAISYALNLAGLMDDKTYQGEVDRFNANMEENAALMESRSKDAIAAMEWATDSGSVYRQGYRLGVQSAEKEAARKFVGPPSELGMSPADREIMEKRRELQDLIEQYNNPNPFPSTSGVGEHIGEDWGTKIEEAVNNAAEKTAGQLPSIAARGSFFAADARGLGKEGLSYQERAARASEDLFNELKGFRRDVVDKIVVS